MNNGYLVKEQDLDYKILFEKSPDASLIIEGDRIIRCNDAAVEMFELLSKDQLIGKKVYGLFPKRQLDGSLSIKKAKELVRQAEENEVSKFEWTHSRRCGTLFYVEIVMVVIPINGKKVINVSLRDITEKIKARILLKTNEDIYQDMFEKNHANMLLADGDTGEIVDANPAACAFYGYDKEQFITMNVTDLSIGSHHEVFNRIEDVKCNKGKHYYFKDQLASGEIKDVEAYSGSINKNGRELVYSIIHDVTEKNKALEALKESEKKFKTLFNNANDLIFLNHAEDPSSSGQFIEVNEAACKRLGYTREELLEKTPSHITVDKAEGELAGYRKEIYKNGCATFETTLISKRGYEIPVEVNLHTFKLFETQVELSIVRDITERKQIEVSLIKSKEKYRKLMDFLPESVLIIDKEIILFSNATATKFLGFDTFNDMINRPLLDFIYWEDYDDMVEWINKIQRNKNSKPLVEIRFIKKDGSIAYGNIVETKVSFNDQESTMMIIRDITEQKEAKKLLEETIKYDKLKTEFFVNIAHELRTPLNVIFGALQLLELDFKQDEIEKKEALLGVDKRIKSMKQNCYRLLRLVNNIIDITKIESGYYQLELQNVDIVNVVENITMSVSEYMEIRGINLQFDTQVESKLIACDPDKMERIMLNLLANAIKFTESGGQIKVNMYEKEENMMISIQDTGIGIPEDRINVIFERFSQVDRSLTRSHEGSGIGLSLVKSLVELQGGQITVKSKIGQGSEFIIALPIGLLSNESTEYTQQEKSRQNKVEKVKIEFSDIYT
ncbi:PAS/PAC sensor signal transduction histidine kinase [Alkaliphilus metalliredigens QYMF]|uniref:histidine kinase n=1 Tax=Alkaliphilus metalliredigens (strain QYMF) TaxID=293826 RepID=A6TWD7_ALKMQ|nr:PAS domain-containing sensor histidine kinase [Alkaliphilus metalliredigens]ABR50505.1 PAS/PAC sensor signal transduction histidine kinase [Alkaliphilus metalliredigens QYMF]